MPEGPEIRLAADRVAKVLVGKKIVDVAFGLERLSRFKKGLIGVTVAAVDTRGKAMLTRFDNGLTMYSHNQLYGRWYTMKRPRLPKTNRSLRAALYTGTHAALLYSASDIEILDEAQLLEHPFLRRIGPDILCRSLTEVDIVERLQAKQFRGRALGSLYLDQSFLAGNGNYLRSEILWAAALNPSRRAADLESAERQRLAAETLRLSRRSYRTRGITVNPSLASSLKESGLTRSQYRFFVFGREGLSCYRCRGAVSRTLMSSRNLFSCPVCQA